MKYETFWATIAQVLPVLMFTLFAYIYYTRQSDRWTSYGNPAKLFLNIIHSLAALLAAFVEVQAFSILAGYGSQESIWRILAIFCLDFFIILLFVEPAAALFAAGALRATRPNSRLISRRKRRLKEQTQRQKGTLMNMISSVEHRIATLEDMEQRAEGLHQNLSESPILVENALSEHVQEEDPRNLADLIELQAQMKEARDKLISLLADLRSTYSEVHTHYLSIDTDYAEEYAAALQKGALAIELTKRFPSI